MKTLRIWQQLAIALCLIFGLTTTAYAANANARIKGTVTDASGAVLPGVQVTATNVATGVKFTAQSGADGLYLFPQLPIGTYAVSASAPNFKKFTASGIVLNIDQEYIENITMTIGSNAETVQVNASAVQVDTTDMQLSNVVNSEQMVELPIINRNFTGLELSLPGVQASSDRFGTFSVSGAQTQQSEYLVNGADTNDITLNTLTIAPNLDAIDQFNLIEGPLNAEYDRNSGGIVSATIKQGTNHFHGDGFEFYRDTFLNTLSYYQKTLHKTTGKYTGTVTPFHQNIFGGTVGGPVLRDRLFFFGAYQGTRQVVPQGSTANGITAGTSLVYSPANLAGDFSYDAGSFSTNPIPSSVTVPGCTAGETWADCAASNGGVFPTTAFNPIAAKLVSTYLPKPNNGTYGYTFNPVVTTTTDQEIARVDFAVNPRNQFYGLWITQKSKSPETLPFTGASVPGFGDQSQSNINQITADYVRQFSPTLVNDLAAHWTRFNFKAVTPQKVVLPSSVGFDINPQIASGAGLPAMFVSGGEQEFELGFSTNGPQPRIDQVEQFDDTISKVVGKHSLKFGYDGRRFTVSNPFGATNNGSYAFNGTGPYSTGDAGLDFLLGIPDTYAQGSGAQIQADAFLNYVFGQDTWKVTDALTLNYGLGYSIDSPLHNNQYQGEAVMCIIPGQQSKIFPTAPAGINYPGDPGCSNAGQAKTRYSELGPRFGFAWAPTGSGWLSGGDRRLFAIRGGFGIYYNRTEEESSLQTLETPPFGTNSTGVTTAIPGTSPSFANPFEDINGGGTARNPFPYTFPKKGDNVDFTLLEPIYNVSTYGPEFRAPYSENMQLSLERQMPSQIVARVSYVGNLSRHNQSVYAANPETPAGHAACAAGMEFSPVAGGDIDCSDPDNAAEQSLLFPQNTASGYVDPATGLPPYLDIGVVGSGAASSYHSLQAELTKGATHGLTMQVSYTYSHATDTASSFENSGFGGSVRGYNQWNKQLNYGDSAFDARQRLVISPLYIVPKFAGPAYNFKNTAFAGWQISGILVMATGFPFDVSYGGLTSRSLWCSYFTNYYACPDVPNQLAPVARQNPRATRKGSSSTYFAKTLFAPEPIGQFGNTHRNPAHGPGTINSNVVLAKNIYLSTEHDIRFQIRLESDNVFNHTNFNNPTSRYGSGAFGLITGTAAARQTQLGAKFYF